MGGFKQSTNNVLTKIKIPRPLFLIQIMTEQNLTCGKTTKATRKNCGLMFELKASNDMIFKIVNVLFMYLALAISSIILTGTGNIKSQNS